MIHGQHATQPELHGEALLLPLADDDDWPNAPVLEIGGWGVHVPHDLTWALEHEAPPEGHARFSCLQDLGALPALVERIEDEG